MIAKYNRTSLMLGVPGLLIQVGCLFMKNMMLAKAQSGGDASSTAMVGLWAFGSLIGSLLLIVGLCYYAKAKGYSTLFGLLGLLSCIGLIILAVMPDKTKNPEESTN